MAFQFLKQNGWSGLFNSRDARDIGNGLSKAQNISLDVGGKIRTIGGLADFTKVDGTTALTQTAKIAPGSGLFTYGSDHWQGTDTLVDLLADNNATADQQAEADATTGWSIFDGQPQEDVDISSNTPANFGIASNGTTYVMKILHASGNLGGVYQAITTVVGQKYLLSMALYPTGASDQNIGIGTTLPVNEVLTVDKFMPFFTDSTWATNSFEFIATATTTYIAIECVNTIYADNVYLTKVPRSDLDADWLRWTLRFSRVSMIFKSVLFFFIILSLCVYEKC